MSTDSVPAPDDQHNPDIRYPNVIYFEAKRLQRLRAAGAPAPKPAAKPRRRRREDRKSGLWVIVHAAREHGFTHPDNGFWVMLPKEFDAILALEEKAVAQVVLEVLRQTIGKVVRQEWAVISYRHFARAGLMSRSQAEFGITEALEKRYIQRRPLGPRRFEYSIRWRGTN